MPVPLPLLRMIETEQPGEVWQAIRNYSWNKCAQPLSLTGASSEVTRRDRELASVDLLLATGAADLWLAFDERVEKTSTALIEWWARHAPGRAILILDGLSLREVPWVITAAERRGYRIAEARATAAELPPETNTFAKALGFSQRSALANNGAGRGHRFQGAKTDCVDLPWADCAALVGAEPDWILWHRWPDDRVHGLSEAGQGLNTLTAECSRRLTDDAFWALVARLGTGRRLVLCSDHGYAATGHFHDTPEDQSKYLKSVFGSGRCAKPSDEVASWLPPLDLTLTSRHGVHRYALGQRKWKSQGGYPTLTHGGLSILEVLSPFVELIRTE
jgi:hypothetical protein